MMGQPEDITLAIAANDEIDVVQAAMKHAALNRTGERIVFIDELSDRPDLRGRIERVKIEHGMVP